MPLDTDMTSSLRFSRSVAVLLSIVVTGSIVLAAAAPAADSADTWYPDWAMTATYNRPLAVLDTDGALGRRNLRPKVLTLRDVARVHGHLCDGLVVAWVELGVALRALFPDGVVDRTDLRAVSKNGPCWVDAAAWTTGARINHGTLALDNEVGNGFIVERVSTRMAVQVSLNAGVVPAEFAELERVIRSRRAAGQPVDAEAIDRVERQADALSRKLLTTAPETLVRLEPLANFRFPAESRNPIAPRGDTIDRDMPRSGPAGKLDGASHGCLEAGM